MEAQAVQLPGQGLRGKEIGTAVLGSAGGKRFETWGIGCCSPQKCVVEHGKRKGEAQTNGVVQRKSERTILYC